MQRADFSQHQDNCARAARYDEQQELLSLQDPELAAMNQELPLYIREILGELLLVFRSALGVGRLGAINQQVYLRIDIIYDKTKSNLRKRFTVRGAAPLLFRDAAQLKNLECREFIEALHRTVSRPHKDGSVSCGLVTYVWLASQTYGPAASIVSELFLRLYRRV